MQLGKKLIISHFLISSISIMHQFPLSNLYPHLLNWTPSESTALTPPKLPEVPGVIIRKDDGFHGRFARLENTAGGNWDAGEHGISQWNMEQHTNISGVCSSDWAPAPNKNKISVILTVFSVYFSTILINKFVPKHAKLHCNPWSETQLGMTPFEPTYDM